MTGGASFIPFATVTPDGQLMVAVDNYAGAQATGKLGRGSISAPPTASRFRPLRSIWPEPVRDRVSITERPPGDRRDRDLGRRYARRAHDQHHAAPGVEGDRRRVRGAVPDGGGRAAVRRRARRPRARAARSDSMDAQHPFGTRVTRVALGALVGAALAPSGVAFQALLRNPLADPVRPRHLRRRGGGGHAGDRARRGRRAARRWTLPVWAFARRAGDRSRWCSPSAACAGGWCRTWRCSPAWWSTRSPARIIVAIRVFASPNAAARGALLAHRHLGAVDGGQLARSRSTWSSALRCCYALRGGDERLRARRRGGAHRRHRHRSARAARSSSPLRCSPARRWRSPDPSASSASWCRTRCAADRARPSRAAAGGGAGGGGVRRRCRHARRGSPFSRSAPSRRWACSPRSSGAPFFLVVLRRRGARAGVLMRRRAMSSLLLLLGSSLPPRRRPRARRRATSTTSAATSRSPRAPPRRSRSRPRRPRSSTRSAPAPRSSASTATATCRPRRRASRASAPTSIPASSASWRCARRGLHRHQRQHRGHRRGSGARSASRCSSAAPAARRDLSPTSSSDRRRGRPRGGGRARWLRACGRACRSRARGVAGKPPVRTLVVVWPEPLVVAGRAQPRRRPAARRGRRSTSPTTRRSRFPPTASSGCSRARPR